MGFKQCSSCKGYYNANRGGCINPECTACDRARTANLISTPVIPKAKPRRPVTKPWVKPKPKRPDTKPSIKKKPRPASGIGTPPKLAGPSPVVVLKSDTMAESELQRSDIGYHNIYRGDTRTPSQLTAYDGFTAWVELSKEQARNVIRRSQGQNFNLKLPKEAKRLEDAFNRNMNLNLLTLGRQIKLEKAGDTFHVSTDPTEGCGGYASGYIYAMKFKTLYLIDKAGNVSTGSLKDVRGINPKLVLDTPSLSNANIIGLAIPGQAGVEVAFLTKIPMKNIYKYRIPQGQGWNYLESE